MKRAELEKHLKQRVMVTLFDGSSYAGWLQKTGDELFQNNPNLSLVKNYYVLTPCEDATEGCSCLFRCSHVKRVSAYDMERVNTHLMEELIDYLESVGAWGDTTAYCNGHRYGQNGCGELRKTKAGTSYRDKGCCNVSERLAFCNPDTVTLTFEGALYGHLNGTCTDVPKRLNEIGWRYGMYYEQGYAWSLAFYPI